MKYYYSKGVIIFQVLAYQLIQLIFIKNFKILLKNYELIKIEDKYLHSTFR